MKLYMIRHGESEANLYHRHAGWQQVSLTEKGVAQAKNVGAYLRNIHFDKIYASDLIRAMQTAEHALPGCEYETDSNLREMAVGTLAGHTREEWTAIYGESYLKARATVDYTAYGGENREMLTARARRFLEKVAKEDFDTVAVFTHAGLIRMVLEVALECRIEPIWVDQPNCMVAVFELGKGHLKLCGWNVANGDSASNSME